MYVSCLSSRDVAMSHSVSWSWVVRSLRRSILPEFPFPLVVMMVGVHGVRHQDNDGDQINTLMECTLDREDCASLRSPFILPYAWISRRDYCLVGVSCHIPSSGLSYACFHLSIMFKFLKPELRNFGSLKTLNKKKAKPLKSHSLFQNALLRCLIFLARVLIQTKNIEHF